MRNTFVGLAMVLGCLCGVSLGQDTQRENRQSDPGATRAATGQAGASGQAGQSSASGQAGQAGRSGQAGASGQTGSSQSGVAGQSGRSGSQFGQAGHAGGASGSTSDQEIAAFIYGMCHNELELAQFAQSKLQSEEAREFAQKLIRDHQPGCEKMKQAAGSLAAHLGGNTTGAGSDAQRPGADRPGSDRPGSEGAGAAGRSGTSGAGTSAVGASRTESSGPQAGASGQSSLSSQPGASGRSATTGQAGVSGQAGGTQIGAGSTQLGGTNRTAGAGGEVDWNTIHSQIAQQCLQSTKQELSSHQGDDFDKAFLGQQLVAHMDMLAKLQVLGKHASGELRQNIEQESQLVQAHIQQAKQLMQQLKDRPSERVSRRPESK